MSDGGAVTAFVAAFGLTPDAHAVAPGRVNLIGEHTDYHQGFVLPLVLPQHTTVYLRRTTDGRIRALSLAMGPRVHEYAVGAEAPTGTWVDFVQGVTWAAHRRGLQVPGGDLLIESTVPAGAGVSSSAALEVALLRAFREAYAMTLDDNAIARLAHDAETGFVGAAVGFMDQMACSVGRPGAALFLDLRSLVVEHLPIPATIDLAVIDSGIAHRHAGGEYGDRRRESFEAAAALGVSFLRDITAAGMDQRPRLPPLLQRRARHVVTENDRVVAAVAALKAGDGRRLGALFNASHASMRDDYEVSLPAIDRLVSLAQADPQAYGARMTGGGFGGAVVAVTQAQAAAPVAARVLEAYQRFEPGLASRVLLPSPAMR
jgi:galactokinase